MLSHFQPFGSSIYGDYRLVEALTDGLQSPLSLDWKLFCDLDGDQFGAYCRISLIAFEGYIKSGPVPRRSKAIYQALDIIGHAGDGLYKLNGQPLDSWDISPSKKISDAVIFLNDCIKMIDTEKNIDLGKLRIKSKNLSNYILDDMAQTAYNILLSASSVKTPPDECWFIHYNCFWGRLIVGNEKSKAWNMFRFKFFRLIFDEIKHMEIFPNFEGAGILGICLNVLGVESNSAPRGKGEHILKKAILNWTKKNYLYLVQENPRVAEACLIGSITYDSKRKRLVKTYAQGLSREPVSTYLKLDTISESAISLRHGETA